MSYNQTLSVSHIDTAGKITILTTFLGVVVFALVFLLNLGQTQFNEVRAQDTATTSVTVLNTPPQWSVLAYELVESSTSTPTNSGDTITWTGVATDSNNEDYQMIVCSNNATPTPGSSTTSPQCGTGAIAWAVSAVTNSDTAANAATTTTEAAPFSERENWFAWICDAIDLNARCNAVFSTGLAATNSSPFHVNSRPTFTAFSDNSPADPGDTVTFFATSTDSDVIGGADTLELVVCATTSYNGTTNSCDGTTLATTTVPVTSNPDASYTVVIPTQDDTYTAFGYVFDEHGHEASGGSQGTDAVLVINNVAPTVASSSIIINNGNDLVLTVEEGETTGFTLQFTATDNNSCQTSIGGEEVTDYAVSLYRSGVTCDALTSGYNANFCYPSASGTAVWNLSCSATTTPNDCNFGNDGTDRTRIFSCDYPLWYVADPTDGGATNTVHFAQDWDAQVRAIDDDGATGTPSVSDSGQELNSLLAFALNTLTIPYGELEPGNDTGTLAASTTIAATGNVGLDQGLIGESMCGTYTPSSECPVSASSTIPESEQQFATSELAYGAGTALSSSTQQELELDVNKTISTSTPATGTTYWGIAVPGSITLAGVYTGENTFVAIAAEPGDW